MAQAIRNNDPDEAAAEFRTLLRRQGEAVVELLEARGIFGPTPASAAPAGA